MDWLHPTYLLALLAAPAAVGLFLWAAWQRRKAFERFGDRSLVRRLASAVSPRRRRYKATVVVLGLLALVVALAGPRFGSKLQEFKREGVDLVIALDVSESMLAQDVLPNRLTRAKFEIRKLLDELTGDRVGLVLFAGDAFVQCPLTLDYSAFQLFLDIAEPSLIPTPGTNYNAAVNRILQMFESTGTQTQEPNRTKAVIFVSDGENHVEAEDLIDAARRAEVIMFAAGVGETEGVPIPQYQNGRQVGFKKDKQGNNVQTKLEEEALLQLTRDGGYFRITRTASSLSDLTEALQRLDKHAFDQQVFEEYEEKFQWPLALALFLFIAERVMSDRRPVQTQPETAPDDADA